MELIGGSISNVNYPIKFENKLSFNKVSAWYTHQDNFVSITQKSIELTLNINSNRAYVKF